MPRASALVALLLLVPLAIGCVERAPPGQSVPLQFVAEKPPPIGVGENVVVAYDLDTIQAATPFIGEWDDDRGAAALQDMGYEQVEERLFVQDGEVLVRIEERPGGFWFNLTYAGERLDAATPEEAEQLAHEAWAAREPHFLGTLAGFEERTGWKPDDEPRLSYAFSTNLRRAP